MRRSAGLVLGVALAGLASAAQAAVGSPGAVPSGSLAPTKIEYFCSPGFEPSYGGTCVAVAPRAEIEQFVDQPIYGEARPYRTFRRHIRRRHGIRERY